MRSNGKARGCGQLTIFFLIFCFIVFILFILFQFFNGAKSNSDSPAIIEAQTNSRLEAISRDMSSASFLTSFFQWAAVVILILAVTGFLAALLMLMAHIKHRQRVELIRLQYDTSMLMPTVEGNYPALVVNRRLGEVMRIKPGNKPYPATPAQYVIGNSPLARIPTSRHDVPILVNQRAVMPSTPEYIIEPQRLDQPEQGRELIQSFEANSSSEPFQFQEFGELLARAKQKGRGKNESIQAVTGVKPGGSKAYKQYSTFWDNCQ